MFFSMLADTVDRNNKKYQAKVKKMEHQMLAMVEKHTAQVFIKKILILFFYDLIKS